MDASVESDSNQLSQRDIRLLTRALIGMVSVTEKVTYECLDNAPPSASRARAMFDNSKNHGPPNHIMDAYLLMQYANLSGSDHVRAFVALIRASTVRSTALATVTRGALESFARTWYLLGHSGEMDLVHRSLSILYADLRYPARYNETVLTRDGDPIDPSARRAFYLEELARLGLPSPATIEIGHAVGGMLDAEFDDGAGKLRYSTLSSVAHGHRLGVNAFIVTDETGGVAALVAPRDIVIEFAVELMAAMSATMEAFAHLFGSSARHLDLIGAATSRAAQSLSMIAPSDSSDEAEG